MIRTGIIVSTQFECAAVLDALAHKRTRFRAGVTFISGRLPAVRQDEAIIVCISGIGKSNAARAATLLIEKYRPSLIINFGVGGAYPSSGLAVGDIVFARRESYGDEGLGLKNDFRDMSTLELPLLVSGENVFHNSFPVAIPKKFKRRRVGLGGFVTVSSCTGTRAAGMIMERRWSAVCENMEGAAIAHVALAYGVPLIEFRSISNVIEDRSGKPLNKQDLRCAASAAQAFFLEAWNGGLFS